MSSTARFVAGWIAVVFALAASAAPSHGATAVDGDADWLYRVAPGDTLIGIGGEFLQDPRMWPQVQRLNQVANPRHLQPNSMLRIPLAWVRHAPVPARLVFVRGEVLLQRAGLPAPRAVATDDLVGAGDTLSTGDDAAATLRFEDGSRMLIVGKSTVLVGDLDAIGSSKLAHSRVTVLRGGSEIKVVPAPRSGQAFDVQTPAVNLGVRGTEFRARFDESRAVAQVEVLEGVVRASRVREAVPVVAGRGLAAPSDAPLAEPVPLLAPPDLGQVPARIERVPLRFEWPRVPNAMSYRAQVFPRGEPERLLLDAAPRDPSAKWVALADGDYVLRVRAVDAQALEGRDADHPFVLKARPEPPLLIAPRQAAKSYGNEAAFNWTLSDKVPRYRLQVSPHEDFSAPLVDRADLAGAEQAVPLAPGVHYYWRMAAIGNGDDQGPFGDAQAFDQRPVPEAPTMKPDFDDANGLVFRWGALASGQRVRYQVASDAAFEQIQIDKTTPDAQGLLPRPAAGRYYVRVGTIDEDGFEGPFGATQQIDVPASPWWFLVPLAFVVWGM